jgi:hypothetical protein
MSGKAGHPWLVRRPGRGPAKTGRAAAAFAKQQAGFRVKPAFI